MMWCFLFVALFYSIFESSFAETERSPPGYLTLNDKSYNSTGQVFEYSFYDGEFANVTCRATHEDTRARIKLFRINDGEVLNATSFNSSVSLHLKLNGEFNGTFLNCTVMNSEHDYYSITVKLYLKKEPQSKNINDVTLYNDIKPDGQFMDPASDKAVLFGAGAGVLLLVFVLGLIVFLLLKKRPEVPKEDPNINYETLPEHNKGTMPIPTQWQEAQYTAPADRIANNDYAVPYKPTLEEMYAKPVPKIQRCEKDDPGYASIDDITEELAKAKAKRVIYAELALTPSVGEKPKVISKENPYAEVKWTENPAEQQLKEFQGYVNDCDSQRYINTNSKDDYAEPAYCEISKAQTKPPFN